MSIYNAMGQRVWTCSIQGIESVEIPTNEFTSGIYTLHFNNELQLAKTRLVVQH
jgi:hypothetical protein